MTIAMLSKRDGKFLLRRTEGIKADITEVNFLCLKVFLTGKFSEYMIFLMSENRIGTEYWRVSSESTGIEMFNSTD